MTEEDFTPDEIDRLRQAMVEQGHAFQHRALHEANLAYTSLGGGWRFQALEFPVQAGRDTRVDFVLAHHNIMLAVECKRVNPAYSRWLFAKAPLTRQPPRRDKLIYDGIERLARDRLKPMAPKVPAPTPTYQIGYAVKTDKKGDAQAGARDAVERALRQAAQGATGLLNYYADTPGALPPGETRFIIPAIFTTAELVVTDIDLTDKVGLEDGEIDAADLRPRRADWILFEYHIEPTLPASDPQAAPWKDPERRFGSEVHKDHTDRERGGAAHFLLQVPL